MESARSATSACEHLPPQRSQARSNQRSVEQSGTLQARLSQRGAARGIFGQRQDRRRQRRRVARVDIDRGIAGDLGQAAAVGAWWTDPGRGRGDLLGAPAQ